METEEKLKKRIAYEKMLAGISERAVSVDDLDEFLDESLRRMGGILDVSRIFIFTYHPVPDIFACICEWVTTGTTTLSGDITTDAATGVLLDGASDVNLLTTWTLRPRTRVLWTFPAATLRVRIC